FFALLVGALGEQSQCEERLRMLEEALAVVRRTGECCYEAELHRIKGEVMLRQVTGRRLSRAAAGGASVFEVESPAFAHDEACFQKSVEIARVQHAKSLELRAAMSFARLYRNPYKQREARGLLIEIHDSFTEGFDSVDMREARELIESLGTVSS